MKEQVFSPISGDIFERIKNKLLLQYSDSSFENKMSDLIAILFVYRSINKESNNTFGFSYITYNSTPNATCHNLNQALTIRIRHHFLLIHGYVIYPKNILFEYYSNNNGTWLIIVDKTTKDCLVFNAL